MSEATGLNLNQVGKQTATIKIKSLPEPTGSKKVGFIEIEGSPKKLKYWTSSLAKLAKPLEVGAEAEAEIECKESEYNGEKIIEAWLLSFGGVSQSAVGGKQGGGNFGGRSFTPKSTEEIHAASICGCVKSAADLVVHLDNLKIEDLPRIIDILADGYWRSLSKAGKAPAVKASPQEAPAADPKKDAYDYWLAGGGTNETHAELKKVCASKGIDWVQHVLEGKRFEALPFDMLRHLVLPGSGIAEPGDFRNPTVQTVPAEEEPETNWYEAFRAISDELRWPGWAEAQVAWESFCKRVLGRPIRDPKHLTQDHYFVMTQFALRVKDGTEDAPAGFAARAKEAINV